VCNDGKGDLSGTLFLWDGSVFRLGDGRDFSIPRGECLDVLIQFKPDAYETYWDMVLIETHAQRCVVFLEGTGYFSPFLCCNPTAQGQIRSGFLTDGLLSIFVLILMLVWRPARTRHEVHR